MVRDREDEFGLAEPRFVGSESECRLVAEALRKAGRRKKWSDDSAEGVEARLLALISALVGLSSKDPQDVARDTVRELHWGSVCQRCDAVYIAEWPERCELCETDLEAA